MSTHNQPKGSFNSSVPGRTKRPSSMRGIVRSVCFFDRNRLQFAVRNRDVRVASEVCFRRIFFPFCRNLILARDYFFSVRVVHRAVLRPGVAGVAHRKNAGPSSLRSGSAVFRRCRTALPSRTPSCSFRWQTHQSAASCGDTAGFLLYKYDCPLLFSKFAQSYAVIMPSVSVRQRSR